jgi:transcriptional regulator with XRE-family HTH domain
MINRIKEIIVKEGLTSGSFADAIGVQRSNMSHILNGRNNPSLDFVIKTLQRFPKVNTEWLLLGTGSMYQNSQSSTIQPVKELSIFDAIPEPDQKRSVPDREKNPLIQADTKIEASKLVSKVLIFYSDHTYDEFLKSEAEENEM